MSIKKLKTDYVTDEIEEPIPKRKYQITNNSDGSVFIDDVTNYSQKGSDFDAGDINNTNRTVNEIIDVIEAASGSGGGETSDVNIPVTANVEKSGNTATITITDKNGTTTATVTDGQDGTDGFSPTITENSDNTDDIYKLDIETKAGLFTTPNLKGQGANVETGITSDEVNDLIDNKMQVSMNGAKIAQDAEGNWGLIAPGTDVVMPFFCGNGNANTINASTDMVDSTTVFVTSDSIVANGYEQIND